MVALFGCQADPSATRTGNPDAEVPLEEGGMNGSEAAEDVDNEGEELSEYLGRNPVFSGTIGGEEYPCRYYEVEFHAQSHEATFALYKDSQGEQTCLLSSSSYFIDPDGVLKGGNAEFNIQMTLGTDDNGDEVPHMVIQLSETGEERSEESFALVREASRESLEDSDRSDKINKWTDLESSTTTPASVPETASVVPEEPATPAPSAEPAQASRFETHVYTPEEPQTPAVAVIPAPRTPVDTHSRPREKPLRRDSEEANLTAAAYLEFMSYFIP